MKERLLWVSIMKTPKAEKLKSGNWRIQIMVNGKRYSLTAPTKKEAQQKAKEVYAGAELEKKIPLTVGKAFDDYISLKEKVLSPSTVRGYRAIRRNDFQLLMNINITELTQADVQRAVGEEIAKGKSAKSIKNSHGLLTAVLKQFRPKLVLNTKLPQKTAKWIQIPTEEEIKKIWKQAEGSRYELPILLASCLGLRMSEIIGLKYSDIRNGTLHVQRARIKGENGYAIKGTKSISGDRWIKWPEFLNEKLSYYMQNYANLNKKADNESDFIFDFEGHLIYDAFRRYCKKAEVGPYRFHDLRHFAASEMHALGVPDKYAMQRMGHSTDNMLKSVYQHTMDEKVDEFSDLIDSHMEQLYNSCAISCAK